jgi:hypothetical protein
LIVVKYKHQKLVCASIWLTGQQFSCSLIEMEFEASVNTSVQISLEFDRQITVKFHSKLPKKGRIQIRPFPIVPRVTRGFREPTNLAKSSDRMPCLEPSMADTMDKFRLKLTGGRSGKQGRRESLNFLSIVKSE